MAPVQRRPPNLVFVMSDDHAAHAISAYTRDGARPAINHTPHLDRLADEGMRFDACFCTNAICTPSRAAVLTGTYNHVNGVTTLDTPMDRSLDTFPKRLRAAGYQTALFGKWHLGHGPTADPDGFDEWRVLPGQGHYHDPVMLEPGPSGEPGSYTIVERGGYVTDLITEDSLDWLDRRDPTRPFALLVHHKAPHRRWEPAPDHFTLFDGVDIPEPPTLWDGHDARSEVVQAVRMRLLDLDPITDLKAPVPEGLDLEAEIRWRYQRFIKDYLRTIQSIDDSMGQLLGYLDDHGLADDTVVVYTSDQGFFLGDHGWFDKRLMYEESLSMPLLIRYPAGVAAGSICDEMVLNVDFAPTFLELTGLEVPGSVQGTSFAPLLRGERPAGWQTSMYYRYWMHRDGAHLAPAHYGVRTRTHKLICFYNDPLEQLGAHGPADPVEWELYDLVADPFELHNLIDDPDHHQVRAELAAELARLQAVVGDEPHPEA